MSRYKLHVDGNKLGLQVRSLAEAHQAAAPEDQGAEVIKLMTWFPNLDRETAVDVLEENIDWLIVEDEMHIPD